MGGGGPGVAEGRKDPEWSCGSPLRSGGPCYGESGAMGSLLPHLTGSLCETASFVSIKKCDRGVCKRYSQTLLVVTVFTKVKSGKRASTH